ncbi:unnamed protein product [Rotaria sordida]|uniref:Uncharacterized protein n=1 Tax=Rotaria sordida TaxID=392033 RepID=A0A820EM77_9BILA|nr:unnamed protein product [Rotaria sordida]
METDKQTQSNVHLTVTTTMNKNNDNTDILPNDMVENNTHCETNEGENNFEVFILKNFTRFSGDQDVNIWLDETVDKLDRSLITTNLRFAAIPLLVKGQAHKVYLKNKRNIQSFDDFTELLLSYFDSRTHTRSQSAIQRRNQRRHAKLKLKQQQFSIKRPIDLNWKPIHVKQVLKQHNIKPARILEVRNHIVTIQFNNAKDHDAADTSLPDDIFNSEHFHQYFNAEQ